MVVAVACVDEHQGDQVMAEHLPMVLSPLLNVGNNNLLQPKCPLGQNIALSDAGKLTVRPSSPQFSKIQEKR